ncbi:hypothetical protein BKA70DRAFT_1426642 [Coprinopsis sp. MPI-PUGE-AT-0042]|nr:hypothetical protein BKA70DRAFT_1426642 [Coprinopsis sp. MPI-PUGE-AT-0042]
MGGIREADFLADDDDDHRFQDVWRDAKSLTEVSRYSRDVVLKTLTEYRRTMPPGPLFFDVVQEDKTDSTKSTQTFYKLQLTADLSMERAEIQPVMQRSTRFQIAPATLMRSLRWSRSFEDDLPIYHGAMDPLIPGILRRQLVALAVSGVNYLETHPLHFTQPLPIQADETCRAAVLLPPSPAPPNRLAAQLNNDRSSSG